MHSTNKKISFISSRDFVEKRLAFAHGGKFFVYFTACKDDILPPEQTVVRGEQIIGLHIYEKVGESVKQTAYSQIDPRLTVGAAVAEKTMPLSVRNWFGKFGRYLEERKN